MRIKEDSVETIKDHCHFPAPVDIQKRKFKKTLKDRAAKAISDVTPRQTIFAAQHNVNRGKTVHLPSYMQARLQKTIGSQKINCCSDQAIQAKKKLKTISS